MHSAAAFLISLIPGPSYIFWSSSERLAYYSELPKHARPRIAIIVLGIAELGSHPRKEKANIAEFCKGPGSTGFFLEFTADRELSAMRPRVDRFGTHYPWLTYCMKPGNKPANMHTQLMQKMV